MSLLAGAAQCDISPRHALPLFGYPQVERISTGIHDPLLATALFLESAGRKVILISLDLLFLDPPTARQLRRAVSGETGIPESGVFIACTHTHSGPVTLNFFSWRKDPVAVRPDADYLREVGERVVKAARDACAKAVSAELVWTEADATGAGGNRHRADGVTDTECGILAVRRAGGGDWLAAALIYGMHPTVLHEDSTLVSSDFPHYARCALQEGLASSIPVLWFTGPCGDQSPRWFVQGQTFAEAERLGRLIGTAAHQAVTGLTSERWSATPVLAGILSEVELPCRLLPAVEVAEADLAARLAEYERLKSEGAPRATVRTAECAVFGARSALELSRSEAGGGITALLAEHAPIEIQVLRLGAACLGGIPGEVFSAYGLDLKHRSPGRIFPVSLVNGELEGYIVTPEAAAAGGYEAANSLYAPEAGPVLVRALIELIGEVQS